MGLRPFGDALDRSVLFHKHGAILLHSSPFVNDVELVCDSRMKMTVAFSLSERKEEESATEHEGSE